MASRESIPKSSDQVYGARQPATADMLKVDSARGSPGETLSPEVASTASTAASAPDTIPPSFSTDLLRPDDLLTLHVDGYNLVLPDPSSPGYDGHVKRIDPNADAFLAFTFPPQHVLEQAYFEASNISPRGQPDPDSGKSSDSPLPPGSSGSRISGPSRLVFKLNSDVGQIPYSSQGLLDWSHLEPALAPLAMMDERPTAAQLAAAPPIERPGTLSTAIELPYRLLISPGPDTLWQHAVAPVSHAGRTELWHTRLMLQEPVTGGIGRGTSKFGGAETVQRASPTLGGSIVELTAHQTAPLRAIWSPDYIPLPQTMPNHSQDSFPFSPLAHSSLTKRDRHMIVVLTSAFTGYSTGDPATQAFLPSPVHAQRLMLSPLGGWLSSRGAWVNLPVPTPSISGVQVIGKELRRSIWSQLGSAVLWPVRGIVRIFQAGPALFTRTKSPIPITLTPIDSGDNHIDMSEWVHIATQGRDQYVKVVYEGHLLPFGHRAALIKITERKFQTVQSGPLAGAPVAWLRQHMFVVVREPEKHYDDVASLSRTYNGRAMPLRSIRLKTLVTPDIAYPYSPPSFIDKTDGSFWIQVMRGTEAVDFNFSVSATDLEGRSIEFTTPMIFVDLNDSFKPAAIGTLQNTYTTDRGGERRACVVPGQKMAYARPSDNGVGDTDLTTSGLYFDLVQCAGAPEVPAGFLPVLDKAKVSVPPLEHLLGIKDPVAIKLAQSYREHDLDPHAGVYAQLYDLKSPLAAKFTADQAGGICTPNLSILGISRALGPVAGDPNNAADPLHDAMSGTFNPGLYFPSTGDAAKLFGVVDLVKLVIGDLNLMTGAPQVTTTTSTPPGGTLQAVTQLHWVPTVPDGSYGPGNLLSTHGTKFTIDEQIVKPLAGGTPVKFDLHGTLENFDVELVKIIKLAFKSFKFTSQSGQKTQVAVALSDSTPITFEGPLEFVNQLSQIIPASVFGDSGPSLTVSPTGVQVGYNLAIPPLSVAVFALHSITLGAALDLPFLDGKPHLDFSISKRHDPFILTISLLGGGGFLHLELDAEGMIMVEGALEFGGEFALDIGVASGSVHIMAGIYFQIQAEQSDLTGFVDVGGEVSVLGIVSVSVDFNLSLSYVSEPGENKVQGRATLSVEVHVACFSKSVDMEVDRSYGSHGGDPTIGDVLNEATWQDYAAAFAPTNASAA